MNSNKDKDLILRAKQVADLLLVGHPSDLELEAAESIASLIDLISDRVHPPALNPSLNQPEPWSVEMMKLINRLTPDIKGKAFDPDWFLLRQRLEEYDQLLKMWQTLTRGEL